MYFPCVWILDPFWDDLICFQVERVADYQFLALNPCQRSHVKERIAKLCIRREDKRLAMCGALYQMKWCWHHVHFPITDHDIAIRAKALYTLVFVDVFVVGVQKITM